MALPKIDLPVYNVYLDTQNRDVKFRPFIVKEEKILLMALESGDINEIMNAIKTVITGCLIDDVDIETLPLFEIEKLFLHLRARSMGEIVNVTYICQNDVDDKKCKFEMDVEIDLLKSVTEHKVVSDVVKLNDDVGLKLKYPNLGVTKLLNSKGDDLDIVIDLIEQCTDYLFDAEQVYQVSEMQEGEFRGFIESLTQEQFASIRVFFDSLPKLIYDTEVSCGRCGKVHQIHLEGLTDFFE